MLAHELDSIHVDFLLALVDVFWDIHYEVGLALAEIVNEVAEIAALLSVDKRLKLLDRRRGLDLKQVDRSSGLYLPQHVDDSDFLESFLDCKEIQIAHSNNVVVETHQMLSEFCSEFIDKSVDLSAACQYNQLLHQSRTCFAPLDFHLAVCSNLPTELFRERFVDVPKKKHLVHP